MTAADKLRELLATRPAQPNLEELARWWSTSGVLVPEVLDRLENDTCERHAGKAHGAEAEELRGGIERLLASVARAEGHDPRLVLLDLRRDLQRLLDRVDARDSLAHLEDRDAAVDVLKQEVRELEQQREQFIAYVDDAKRAAGSARVGGEPLADFITRLRGEYHQLRAELERARAALALRERMEDGHA